MLEKLLAWEEQQCSLTSKEQGELSSSHSTAAPGALIHSLIYSSFEMSQFREHFYFHSRGVTRNDQMLFPEASITALK